MWRRSVGYGASISFRASIREIARDLKLSRNTVRKVLRSAETAFFYGREVQPRPKLGRWTEDLDRLLARNADGRASG